MRAAWIVVVAAGCATGERVPVYEPGDDGWGYEVPEAEGECGTDLGCDLNGCGNHCTAADAEPFVGSCEYAAHNDYAECGCVEGRCRWYTHPVNVLTGSM
jgi:hypothetical protein